MASLLKARIEKGDVDHVDIERFFLGENGYWGHWSEHLVSYGRNSRFYADEQSYYNLIKCLKKNGYIVDNSKFQLEKQYCRVTLERVS
jgi:hypothetical protein